MIQKLDILRGKLATIYNNSSYGFKSLQPYFPAVNAAFIINPLYYKSNYKQKSRHISKNPGTSAYKYKRALILNYKYKVP